MTKIEFLDNNEPPLSASNLNAIQDNVEDAIGDVQTQVDDIVKSTTTTSDTSSYSCTYLNNMYKVYGINFNTGSISANNDLYDMTHTITSSEIPDTYTPIGIVGENKTGAYYSHCTFTRLYVGGTNNRTIYWAIKNTSSTAITNGIVVTIYILAVKN